MKLSRCVSAMLCLFLLAGCSSRESQVFQENIPTVDWKTNGFAVSGEAKEEQKLWVESHIRWEHEEIIWDEETEANFPILDAVYQNGKIYLLHPIAVKPDANTVRGVLEIFDTYNMENTMEEITQQLSFSSTDFILTGMDVIGDGNYAFRTKEFDVDEDGQVTQIYDGITYMNSEENIQRIDLLPIFIKKGIIEENDSSIRIDEDCFCDVAGNIYFRSPNCSELYILDKDGELLTEYKGSGQEFIGRPLKTEEGELIFYIHDNDKDSTRLVWFNIETGKACFLAELEREWIKQLYGIQGNYLYYEGQNGIVRWDVASGTRQLVFRFDENGINKIYQTMLVLREGMNPILRTYGTVNGEEEDWLVVLSEEPVQKPDAIRVSGMKVVSDRIQNCTTVASRRNPDYSYILEECEEKDMNDYRTRIMAELSAGGGPDLLYVSLEDMELLQKRGLLADLRTLLSEETLCKVMPGVIEMGTVDGTLVGMAPGVMAETLLISESAWNENTWTLENVIDLMEEGKIENKILSTATGGAESENPIYFASLGAQRALVNCSLGNSFLIDWEKRESHFEDERFIRLLKCIGVYGSGSLEYLWGDGKDGGDVMVEVMLSSTNSIIDFHGTHMADGIHYVGYPSNSGNGSYLYTDGMLVVNRNLTDPKAVSAYLECLWGSEVQNSEDRRGYSLPVTYPSADDIRYDAETGEAWWNGERLTVFKDGTTSLDETIIFLAQCVPAPKTYTYLERIIYEELSTYYEEPGRTAEDTARIIDSRVQVYLDEGN